MYAIRSYYVTDQEIEKDAVLEKCRLARKADKVKVKEDASKKTEEEKQESIQRCIALELDIEKSEEINNKAKLAAEQAKKEA